MQNVTPNQADNDRDAAQVMEGLKLAFSDEEAMPSKAAIIHQRIRFEGEQELDRHVSALLISAIAAGLTVSSSMITKGLIYTALPGFAYVHFVASFGYAAGFVLVILARQQLFTENTVTAVIPVLSHPTWGNVYRLGRLWGVVLLGNLLGTFLMALTLYYSPAFTDVTKSYFIAFGEEVMHHSAGVIFCKGIFSGWLIATMVWILANLKNGQFIIIVLITYIMSLGEFTHIVVGSTEIFYLLLAGKITLIDAIYPFAFPILLGNVVGGTVIFTLLSHIQIRSDMSSLN